MRFTDHRNRELIKQIIEAIKAELPGVVVADYHDYGWTVSVVNHATRHAVFIARLFRDRDPNSDSLYDRAALYAEAEMSDVPKIIELLKTPAEGVTSTLPTEGGNDAV